MINNDLKKLNRLELLDIILAQTKRIEELELQITKLKEELSSKKISLHNSGSLAEASLKLTEIFKEADNAATIYKDNIIAKAKKEERQLKKELKELKQKKLAEIEKKCQVRETQAEKKLKEVEEKINKLKDKDSTKKTISKAKTAKRKFK